MKYFNHGDKDMNSSERNKTIFFQYIDDAKECINELSLKEGERNASSLENLDALLNSIEKDAKNISEKEAPTDTKNQNIFNLMMQVNLLHTEVDCLVTRIALMTIKDLIGKKITYLKSIINGIASTLWNFISSMVTPKQWQISGGLGYSVFGLQGSAQLTICFGN